MAHAPASDQMTLLDVASLDRRIARLERDDLKHPLRQELGSLLNATAAKAREKTVAERALADAQGRLADAERLSAGYGDQVAGRQAKLEAGTGLTSRDLLVLQEEIDGLRKLLDEAAEAEFAALEEVETLQAKVEEIGGEIAELDAATLRKRALLEDEVTKIRAELDEAASEREALIEPLAPELTKIYEHARATGGFAVIAMRPDGSTGAGISLSPVEVAQIKATPPDEIYLSEEYDCIIVRVE